MTVWKSFLLIAAVVVFPVCAGCGSNYSKPAPVAGRITFQGKPVTEGVVIFHPQRGRPAIGIIGPDGAYKLTTYKKDDGAVPGKYIVTIESKRVSGGSRPKSLHEELTQGSSIEPPTVNWLVPEKYARPDTSPLTAEVVAGQNAFDFNL